jgi:effector-binding domain-containing protein
MSFMTEPKIEDRKVQPYMGIRTRVPMQELDVVIPQCIGEVFALLGKQGVAPVHAPFVRYHVINMPEMLDIEIGIPVASALPDEGRIHGGVLPAGRYASLIYTGIDNGRQANAALLDWCGTGGRRRMVMRSARAWSPSLPGRMRSQIEGNGRLRLRFGWPIVRRSRLSL